MKHRGQFFLIFLLATLPIHAQSQPARPASNRADSPDRPVILSTTRPKDSLNEVVYELRPADSQEPAITGAFVYPRVTHQAPLKLSKQSKKELKHAGFLSTRHATVLGIVTESGDFIDGTIEQAPGTETGQSVLDSVSNYRFQPATLDGKPVAMFVRLDVAIKVF